MRNNSQTNSLIKGFIILGDFLLLYILLVCFEEFRFPHWGEVKIRIFFMMSFIALLFSEYFNSPIIHRRLVTSEAILQRIFQLTLLQTTLSIVLMKSLEMDFIGGTVLLQFGAIYFVIVLVARFTERMVIRYFRQLGRNTRTVLFIGSDSELFNIYNRLEDEASKGYKILGYYADEEMVNTPNNMELQWLGTLKEFMNGMADPNSLKVGDDMYVCISRRERETVRKLSRFCDQHVIRFYFVPVSVETLGIDLKREMLDDIEVYTTYEIPLANPVNKLIKRFFDIVLSLVFLIPTAILFPFVYVIIKLQSPGPIFFKQARTGLDGRDFNMLKFRSMHVNKDADRLQATKDDPRKYPFGNFMRKSNIDELPQFLNVLKGDMSIVGPRPHMLAHTEQYSQLIDKYMVRHFVKPGLTGWAQVTGFRGETKELWQMEGRVKRDIWYIEHWSIWLDIRIIWMTAKTIFIHDKNAY
jgi:putative colanic acid biosynthesis UDP-glucose lipid carrier transferase